MNILYSVYVWIVGGIYVIFVLIFGILLSFVMKPKTFDPLFKKWVKILFKLMFVKVRIEGGDNVDPAQSHLFMANHSSIFDIPLCEAFIPQFVRGVEAKRQFRWPLYGWAIRRFGNIPIDRKNIHASIRSMRKAEKVLKEGRSMIILPEGHRTVTGTLNPFKRLPFFLAKQAGIPILPMGISGVFQLKHKGSWRIRRHPITIRFGKPVDTKTINLTHADELRDLIRDRIQGLLD